MKSKKPAQTDAVRDVSDAVLAKSFLDVQRLRDEVRKAELVAAAKRRRKAVDHGTAASATP